MAQGPSAQSRQQGLEQAASVMFALVGIVPLLVFAFTLWQIGVVHRSLAQASLGLTLALMLLGFWLFRSMLAQMSEIVRGLSRATEQAARARAVAAAPGAGRPALVPTPMTVAAPVRRVAGLGAIRELGEMARTMDLLWQREAHVHVGRRVQVSVANAVEMAGRLMEATEDGLLLEQENGTTVAIAYRRVQGIERTT